MTVPSHVDPVTWFAHACGAVLRNPNTPQPLRDRLFTFVAQLRDGLSAEQARATDAAEAEAVINSFVSPDLTQSLTRPAEEILPGEPLKTSGAQARPLSSL